MTTTSSAAEHGKPETAFDIIVNTKKVSVEKHNLTGLEIKDAAIAQGVKIKRDFTLTEELPGDKSRTILDDQVVGVHEGSEFTAVTPDDNS